MATFTPARISDWATPRPIPFEPPVIRATLPLMLFMRPRLSRVPDSLITATGHNGRNMGDAFRIEIDLPAPPDRLWRYLTDANALATWYWPRQMEPTYESDPVLGGYFRIASQKAGVGVQGYYLEAEAPNRFVKTWSWDNEDSET